MERNKLIEKATAAASRGKYARAQKAYAELEKLEPANGSWARRSGEMFRHLGKQVDAVAAFTRSASAYAEAGFLVKAIAVCKLVLRIDPSHRAANEKLHVLTAKRFTRPKRRTLTTPAPLPDDSLAPSIPPAAIKNSPVTPPTIPPVSKRKRPTIPPGQFIEEVRLADAVPGSRPSSIDDRITLIPIDDSEFDNAFETLADTITDTMSSALRTTALFDGLAQANLELLIDNLILQDVAAGEVVFREGDEGNELYVINEGEVRVLVEVAGQPALEVSRLGEGGFFGEVALIAKTPRNATIEATVNTELLVLSRDTIAELIEISPSVLVLLLRFLRDRLFDRLSKTHQLLSSFSPTDKRELADRFQFLEVEAGVTLISSGQLASSLFVVLAGSLEVCRPGREEPLTVLGPGDVTGEMSLLTQEPAIATVRTTSKVFVLSLPGAEFRKLIMTHPQVLAYVAELAATRRDLVESLESKVSVENENAMFAKQQIKLV